MMMALKRPSEVTDRQSAAIDAARAISRRQQALLAAAGDVVPDRHWYVLRVDCGAERTVDTALEAAGVERWLPMASFDQKWRRGRGGMAPGARQEIAWPGYIFVKVADSAACWAGLATVRHVVAVLGGAERPLPVADEDIRIYRAMLEKDEALRRELAGILRPGLRVLVKDGPFAGFPATVVAADRDRAAVEVLIFGRQTLVELDLLRLSRLR